MILLISENGAELKRFEYFLYLQHIPSAFLRKSILPNFFKTPYSGFPVY